MDDDFFLSDPAILKLFMNAGFKFQPSPERLVSNHLGPKIRGDAVKGVPMAEVNFCDHEPWDLPDKSIMKLGDREWYFFSRRDLKYGKSKQLTNRKTKGGQWKVTCKTKPIVSEHTKMQIGEMRTLTFYRTDGPEAVRTGWMVYEFDTITDPSLYENGQYVLCRLENKSKDEMNDKGEQNHQMGSLTSVSASEAEPSRSLDSNSNPTEMAVNSAFHESDLSHYVASDCFDFENQNLNELLTISARQVSELSHDNMASDSGNQNSNKQMSDSAYDGSGSQADSMPLNYCETQNLNQPTVDSVYNGSKSHYMAFDSEIQNSYTIVTMPDDEDQLLAYGTLLMTPDLKDQESPFQNEGERGSLVPMPSKFLENSSSDSEPSSLMDFDWDFKNQNLDADVHYKAFDSEIQNSYNIVTMPDDEDQLLAYGTLLMTPDLKDQESPFQNEGEHGPLVPMPSKFIENSTSDSEPSSLMELDWDFTNQNLDEDVHISDFDESFWSNYLQATTPDFGNQNPCKKTDMSTNLEELYPSYLKDPVSDSDLAGVAFPEVSSECVQVNSPNAALYQPPVCMEESNSSM